MAGDWIKMRADLQTHPKVVRIASALNADRLRAVGGLHAVWCLFDAHSIDGSLEGYTPDALDGLIGCPGFARAMAAVGWLEVSDGSLALPRFDEHNGKSAKRRATETERKREARKAADDPQDAREVSASHADKVRTREEKRREDSSNPPTPRKRGADAGRFEEFWLAWPKGERKQDKAKCLDHWKRNQLDQHADAILADVRTKRSTRKWAEGFIEAPLVYLRGKRWLDGVVPESDGGAEPADWRTTSTGIRRKGVEIGVGDWDEDAFHGGKGEHFPAYRARVEAKVREIESGPADPAGQKKIADLFGGVMKQKETTT
jgi:hypothetical protein